MIKEKNACVILNENFVSYIEHGFRTLIPKTLKIPITMHLKYPSSPLDAATNIYIYTHIVSKSS
jgi:hypothetical protein